MQRPLKLVGRPRRERWPVTHYFFTTEAALEAFHRLRAAGNWSWLTLYDEDGHILEQWRHR